MQIFLFFTIFTNLWNEETLKLKRLTKKSLIAIRKIDGDASIKSNLTAIGN